MLRYQARCSNELFGRLMQKWWRHNEISGKLSTVELLETRILYSADSIAGLTPLLFEEENREVGIFKPSESFVPWQKHSGNDRAAEPLVDSILIDDIARQFEIFASSDAAENNPFSDDITSVLPSSADELNAGVRHVVFIDATLPDIEFLARSISSSDTSVVSVEDHEDALLVVSRTLAQYEELQSLKIISHGEAGFLQIGNSSISESALNSNKMAIARWGDALAEEADILLYGCNVASTDEGESFLNRLAQLTDADVAASTDITGHASLGGNWDLEYATGGVDKNVFLDDDLLKTWESSLASISVDLYSDEFTIAHGTTLDQLLVLQSNGTENVSLREAVYAASQGTPMISTDTADDDIIILSAGNYVIQGDPGKDGEFGDLNILDDLQIIGFGDEATHISLASGSNDRLFHVEAGNVLIKGIAVSGGNSAAQGGAVLAEADTTLSVDDVNFNGNHSDASGGAIRSLGTVNVLNQSSISGNTALGYGGAIHADRVVVESSALNDNKSFSLAGGGGAIAGNEIILSKSALERNEALMGSGGAILAWKNLQLAEFGINDNTASGDGGGVSVDGLFDIQQGIFKGNESINGHAGGINATGITSVSSMDSRIELVQFENNSSDLHGGAIKSDTGLHISKSNFLFNSSDDGGAIYTGKATQISSTNFEHNTAIGFAGGAIYSTSDLRVLNSSFFQNEATNGSGGAIYHDSGESFAIAVSTFGENAAQRGGAILAIDNVSISRSTFVDNSSVTNGAAVHLNNPIVGSGRVDNSLFAHNLTGGLQNNEVSGVKTGSVLNTLNPNIISDGFNVADFDMPGNIESDIDNVNANVDVIGLASDNPELAVKVYKLLPGSPAINAGAPASASATDIAENPLDELPDIGASEYQGNNSVVYWTGDNKVFRSNVDFSNVQLLADNRLAPKAIVVDAGRSQLFWLEDDGKEVISLDLSTSGVQSWKTLSDAYGIAVDSAAAHLYIAFTGVNSRIDRYDIETGELLGTIVSTGINAPIDLEVHAASGKLYWADSGGNGVTSGVYSAQLKMNSTATLIHSAPEVAGIAANNDGTELYWTDKNTRKIVRYDLTAGVELSFYNDVAINPGAITYDLFSGKVLVEVDQVNKIIGLDGQLNGVETEYDHVDFIDELTSATTLNSSAPIVINNNQITLHEKQLSDPIDTSHLLSEDADARDSNIVYNVAYGLDAGVLVVDGMENATSFTQQDISDNLVRYKNTVETATSDSIAFTVSEVVYATDVNGDIVLDVAGNPSIVEIHESFVFLFDVIIIPVNDAPVLTTQSNAIDVAESGEYVLKNSDLLTVDDDENSEFIYRLTKLPDEGGLYLNNVRLPANHTFTQAQLDNGVVKYRPGDDEVNDPVTLEITVSDGELNSAPGTLIFNVIAVNDAPVLSVHSSVIDVAESGQYVLQSTDLVSADPDNAREDLNYRLLNSPSHGELYINGVPLMQGDSFAATDLDAGNIIYRPGDDEFVGLVALEFILSDQVSDSQPGTLTFNVTPFNDIPQLAINGLDVPENTDDIKVADLFVIDENPASVTYEISDPRFEIVGEELRIKPQSILDFESDRPLTLTITATDDEGERISLEHIVTILDRNDPPSVHRIEIQPVIGEKHELPSTTFTDPDGDTLSYVATLTNGESLPGWIEFSSENQEFTVIDPANVSSSLFVRITAHDGRGGSSFVDLQLIFVPVLAASLPSTDSETENTLQITDSENSPAEVVRTPLELIDTVDAIENEAPFHVDEGPEIETQNTFDLKNLIQPIERFGTLVLADVHNPALGNRDLFSNLSTILNVDSINLADFLSQQQAVALSAYDNLATQVDAQQEDWYRQNLSWQTIVGGSVGITSGLSVGYLIWLIRGGTLIGSVLSSLPAWRFVDPLPVLASLADDADEDDETLESMVAEGKSESAEENQETAQR